MQRVYSGWKNSLSEFVSNAALSYLVEDIQLEGGEILSVSMTNIPNGFTFLFMVYYEDNNREKEISEALKKYKYMDFLNKP